MAKVPNLGYTWWSVALHKSAQSATLHLLVILNLKFARQMKEYTEVIGSLAGLCTTVAFLPQLVQIYKAKSGKGISTVMYCIFCFGICLWLCYGWLLGEVPMMVTNAVTLVLALAVLTMKLMWRKRE